MKHLEVIEQVLVPALLLAMGVVVVQAHAIPYWQGAMGPAVGLLGSLGAELVGLYLVYQPGRLPRGIGLLLVGLMVLVPAWVICGPEYRAWREAEAQAREARLTHVAQQAEADARLPVQERDIAAAEASLREDEAKSAVRAGWLPELERQRLALDALRAERLRLVGLAAAPVPTIVGYDWWQAIPTVLPVLGLLIAFQLVNAYAAMRISGWRYGRRVNDVNCEPVRVHIPSSPVNPPAVPTRTPPVHTGEPECEQGVGSPHAPEFTSGARPTSSHGNSPQSPTGANRVHMATGDDLTVRRLQKAIKERAAQAGLSIAEWGRQHDLHKRDLSYLFKHFERARTGARTLSEAKLAGWAKRFLPGALEEAR